MSLFSRPSMSMLAPTGAEVCLIGLAITTVIAFFLWSREVLWCRTALCRALHTARVSAGQRDRYHQVLCLGYPPGGLDIQSFAGWPRHRRGRLDIMLTISIRGGLRAWRSWQRFAGQDVGGHRDQEERYHSMI